MTLRDSYDQAIQEVAMLECTAILTARQLLDPRSLLLLACKSLVQLVKYIRNKK